MLTSSSSCGDRTRSLDPPEEEQAVIHVVSTRVKEPLGRDCFRCATQLWWGYTCPPSSHPAMPHPRPAKVCSLWGGCIHRL